MLGWHNPLLQGLEERSRGWGCAGSPARAATLPAARRSGFGELLPSCSPATPLIPAAPQPMLK